MERHRTDVLSLVFGLLFVAVGIIGVSDRLELSAADVRWVAPGLLVLVGVLLVLPLGRGRTALTAPEADPAVEAPRADEDGAQGSDGGSEAETDTDPVPRATPTDDDL